MFTPSIELIFENLETDYIDTNPFHSMIDPIVNRRFGNTLHYQNGKNQHQHTNKNSSQKYHHSTTRQKYQNRNSRHNISIDILVKNINPYPSKDIEHIQSNN